MTRGIGLAEWLAGLPDVIVFLAAICTQLGDLWFLSVTLVSLYWLGPHTPVLGDAVERDRMATVVGLLLVTVSLAVVLKAIFALPRPPWYDTGGGLDGALGLFTPLHEWFAHAEGYGFPSGHALASTIGWGGLAWAVRAGRQRTRIALASAVVVLVSLTRLIIGVHYLVDVVAGALVGIVVLTLVVRLGSPTVPFVLAPVIGLLGVVLAGLTTDAAGALGLGVGGVLGWAVAGRKVVTLAETRTAYWATAIGLVCLAPILAFAAVGTVPPPVTAFATAVGGVGIVSLPLFATWLEEKFASRP